MSKQLLLVLVFFCIGSYQLKAQIKYPVAEQSVESQGISPEQSDAQIVKTLYTELDGTYEIEVSNPDYKVMYTRTLLETIKSSRLPNQEVTIEWDEFTLITVYPTSAISESSSGN